MFTGSGRQLQNRRGSDFTPTTLQPKQSTIRAKSCSTGLSVFTAILIRSHNTAVFVLARISTLISARISARGRHQGFIYGAPAENGSWYILSLKKNKYGDDEFEIFLSFYDAFTFTRLAVCTIATL